MKKHENEKKKMGENRKEETKKKGHTDISIDVMKNRENRIEKTNNLICKGEDKCRPSTNRSTHLDIQKYI